MHRLRQAILTSPSTRSSKNVPLAVQAFQEAHQACWRCQLDQLQGADRYEALQTTILRVLDEQGAELIFKGERPAMEARVRGRFDDQARLYQARRREAALVLLRACVHQRQSGDMIPSDEVYGLLSQL